VWAVCWLCGLCAGCADVGCADAGCHCVSRSLRCLRARSTNWTEQWHWWKKPSRNWWNCTRLRWLEHTRLSLVSSLHWH